MTSSVPIHGTELSNPSDPAICSRLSSTWPHRHAFLAVGLVMSPGIVVSWFVRDDDVAETRGLVPVPAHSGT
jgi:hypothetical protein